MSNGNENMNEIEQRARPRIIFFGMPGSFSLPVFSTLLASNYEICAVVLPLRSVPGATILPLRLRSAPAAVKPARFALQMADGDPLALLKLAWERDIPVWEVSRLAHPDTVAMLRSFQPDMICVACFSQRVPSIVLSLPRYGCLNVHPSLLPDNRGPEPLFWTFRRGDAVTGVTIHIMDEAMDSGDILLQEQIAVPDGISYAELERCCAQLGGQLLVRAIDDLYAGRAHRQPQDERLSSYYSFPQQEDFVVKPALWRARHLYNFVRGIGHWEAPVVVSTGEEEWCEVRNAISYSHYAIETATEAEHGICLSSEGRGLEELANGNLRVYCSDGWVELR
jgi:methionyl-tRNA formyltransferase